VPRLPLLVLAVTVAVAMGMSAEANAAGPGGWDHLGTGPTPGARSLNGAVRAFNTDQPGTLLVGGSFTEAGGIPDADYVARWDGTSWSALGSPPLTGGVFALEFENGRVFAGGTFTDAGGDPNADFLAVWDGAKWGPFCNASGAPIGGNVEALQIIGRTLWVGGSFQNGGGLATADYLLACDLDTGAATSPYAKDGDGTGSVYALAADATGTLYTGGTGINIAGIPAADYAAAYDGSTWHALGSGTGPGGGAVTGIVRGLGADIADVYFATDAKDVAGIPQADNVARWNGTSWSAVGSNSAGSDGWFPASTSLEAITTLGSRVFAAGSFQNADGDPTADFVADFDGTAWHSVGSNGAVGADGAMNGALNANTLALAVFDDKLFAGGAFTNAGGDTLAFSAASFALTDELPPPVRGEAVNAVPEKGTVLVKLPGPGKAHSAAAGFVPLETLGSQIPIGSTLDTTRGTVLLTAAADAAGKTQDGHISQGLFTVQQSRKNPLTTLKMTGGGLSGCAATKAKAGSARKKRSRSLFSNVKGRFRTRGRNSTATVRGTRYLVKDTCKGTLTKVTSGRVVVRDLALRRTKTLKAGQSYLARAPKLRRQR
jgi:hypothetical protein